MGCRGSKQQQIVVDYSSITNALIEEAKKKEHKKVNIKITALDETGEVRDTNTLNEVTNISSYRNQVMVSSRVEYDPSTTGDVSEFTITKATERSFGPDTLTRTTLQNELLIDPAANSIRQSDCDGPGQFQEDDITDKIEEYSIHCPKIRLNQITRHEILGSGAFGQVWLVSAKLSEDSEEQPYALKIQSKYHLVEKKQVKALRKERRIISQINHPFLVKHIQTFQDDQFVYMLTDFYQGGELFSLLHGKDSTFIMTEEFTQFYASCILDAMLYLHRHRILYRDLKAENILLSGNGYPTLVDFGFAKRLSTTARKTFTFCGTPLYLAPEVILKTGHSFPADNWAFGILIYEMITGYTPFYRKGMYIEEMYRHIIAGDFDFPPTTHIPMSCQIKNLITGLLDVNPEKRFGSTDAYIDHIPSHPWFGDVDYEALRRMQVTSPWQPLLKGPFDRSFYITKGSEQDIMATQYPELSEEEQERFKEF